MGTKPSPHEFYHTPLEGRYASDEMKRLFGDLKKFTTWRQIWYAIARVQHELGVLPITAEQLDFLARRQEIGEGEFAFAAS